MKKKPGRPAKTLEERAEFYIERFGERWAGFNSKGKPTVWVECTKCNLRRAITASAVNALTYYGLCRKCNRNAFHTGVDSRSERPVWNKHVELHY